MKKTFLSLFFLIATITQAHDINYERVILHTWHFTDRTKSLEGSFYSYKDGQVYIEDAASAMHHFSLNQFSTADQRFLSEKIARIEAFNQVKPISRNPVAQTDSSTTTNSVPYFIAIGLLITLGIITFNLKDRTKRKYMAPVLFTGLVLSLVSFNKNALRLASTTTDPLWMDSAFAYFKPSINTFWDTTYFRVESKGIPTTHSMMTGITAWQQQVPIPQCYIGNNAWSIPLNPVLAATPVPVGPSHFLRGAIAVAVNGIPIFNPYTNTGVDALLTGQLDNWGGHCGRADDYHYHIAPLHLYNYISATSPVAFGLDGFAVYGNTEPDGIPVLPLDTNHGHFGANGIYHYHGSSAAPYMIGYMVGRVTEDTTLQIIPQSRATPVRPALTPLNGAVITDCHPNPSNNGYTVSYALSGQTDSIEYSWTSNGLYTFNFYTTGNGIPTTQNYNGFSQCTVPTEVQTIPAAQSTIFLYPNPAKEYFQIGVKDAGLWNAIEKISVYDVRGSLMVSSTDAKRPIIVNGWSAGNYWVVINKGTSNESIKLIVQ